VLPVMTRLKVHHLVNDGGLQQQTVADKLGIHVSSVERILREPAPTPQEVASNVRHGRRGRPSLVDAFRTRVVELLKETPDLPGAEVLRLARGWGYAGKRSALYELIAAVRPPAKREPVILFDGARGEFAQFDFGETWVKFGDGRRLKVTFFAGRLKFSRYARVVVTPNQRAETLIRSLLTCLVAFGGSPKEWVFDRPKTVVISRFGEDVVLHPWLRDLAADMNALPTLCTPASGWEKGSVENLVGFVKKNFFYVRKFADVDDMLRQLEEWHREVNHERPCSATDVIPDVRRLEELAWLQKRPVRHAPEEHPLKESVTISPMATVRYLGTPYAAPPERIGATVTLLVRAKHLDIELDGQRWRHVRCDHATEVQRLPELRRDVLAVIHGKRKVSYFKRQCLLELGPDAQDFMEQLIHRHVGGTWSPVVNDLFDLLQEVPATAMRIALRCCHEQGRYDAASVAAVARRAA
jgi:transposase